MNKIAILSSTAILLLIPGAIFAQSTSGSGTFSGSVPTVFNISNTSDANLSTILGDFSTLTIGKNVLNTPTPLAFRLRSNAAYKLSAQVGSLVGMTDAAAADASTTAQAIKTGDIGFGITASIDQSGTAVVNGGVSPTRTDTIVTGYDVHAGWPSSSNGHVSFSKTLHDLYGAPVQILSGDRISASGDNSSDNNYLTVTLGLATNPQYFTPAATVSGTVTLTIAASGS